MPSAGYSKKSLTAYTQLGNISRKEEGFLKTRYLMLLFWVWRGTGLRHPAVREALHARAPGTFFPRKEWACGLSFCVYALVVCRENGNIFSVCVRFFLVSADSMEAVNPQIQTQEVHVRRQWPTTLDSIQHLPKEYPWQRAVTAE